MLRELEELQSGIEGILEGWKSSTLQSFGKL
jgi:hypothetical protein